MLVVGEVMVELCRAEDGWRVGFAGDTFNTAVLAARAGMNVTYATAVGSDPFSREIVAYGRACGVGMDLALPISTESPSIYAVHVDDRGERTFQYWRANDGFGRLLSAIGTDRLADLAVEAGGLYVSGITLSLFSAADRAALRETAARVRRAGAQVAFDPNYRPARWSGPDEARKAVSDFAGEVDVLMATLDDETALWGDRTAGEVVARWTRDRAREVSVKVGAGGCVVGGPPAVAVPSTSVIPVDTSGAGDAFNAAYLAARRRGQDPAAAAAVGNELAGEAIRHSGALGMLRAPPPSGSQTDVPVGAHETASIGRAS